VTLTPGRLTVSWEGGRPVEVDLRSFEQQIEVALASRRHIFANNPLARSLNLPIEPTGGLGLYVCQGAASFRNVTMETLPEPQP
jgi:hypothetical protein